MTKSVIASSRGRTTSVSHCRKRCGWRLSIWLAVNGAISLVAVGYLGLLGELTKGVDDNGANTHTIHAPVERRIDAQQREYSIASLPEQALLPPQKILRDYIRQHSEQVLRRESDLGNRRFQVVYYSCPQAAGNLLHDFFNQVILAISLNRTILWKYNDPQTCNEVRKGFGGLVCLKANTEPECAQSLNRAKWIAGWDDWQPRIQNLSTTSVNETLLLLPTRDNHAYSTDEWETKLLVAHKPMVYYTQEKQWNGNLLPILKLNEVQNRLKQLYASGPDRLFAMLFRELLPFQPAIYPVEYKFHAKGTTPKRTYAIHSRHFNNDDDGSLIAKERRCLKTVLPPTDPCIVYVMSDRIKTIDNLNEFLQKHYPNCETVIATHNNAGPDDGKLSPSDKNVGHYLEHGPFAGTGYFQDLIVASQARDGFIGHCYRTSSQLLRERIEYDRTMESLHRFGTLPTTQLSTCCLPST